MSFNNYANNVNAINDYSIFIKDVKASKRLRIAINSWATWVNLGERVARASTYNDNIVISEITTQLAQNKENVDFGDLVFRLFEISTNDISWTIPAEWYPELVLDIIVEEEKYHSDTNSSATTNTRPEEIYRFISRINNISPSEKTACLLDIYTLKTDSLDKLKNKIDQEYFKIKKLLSWMEAQADLEAEKTVHIENAIEKISKGKFNIFIKGRNNAKVYIAKNRNQLGFCDSTLNAARKSWNQQRRRSSGLTKQLGLSVKTETAKKLASLAEKYSLNETQVLEAIIRSEFKKEIYLKEITAITKAIDDL